MTAGLDSMIIGEGEILGQVRDAWQLAEHEGASGQLLDRVFRQALVVGKRARNETAIGRQALSIASAAVAVAEQTMFSLRGRSVLVLGAGEVAQGIGRSLLGAGVGEVVVANRTYARAVDLAAKLGGRPVSLGELPDVLASVDVLLTATDSTEVHVEREDIEAVMERRDGAPLLVVDVAVPRDVDPGARQVPGVTLLDMDDLKRFTESSLQGRRREVSRVQSIIMDELERFQTDRTAREMAPIVTSLRRARRRDPRRPSSSGSGPSSTVSTPTRANAVEALTQGMMNKLLHEPTVRLKDAAGTARGELYADALAALFDLPEGIPDDPAPE